MALPVRLQNFLHTVSGAAGKERALALKAKDPVVTEQLQRAQLQAWTILGAQFEKNGKVLTREELATVPLEGVKVGPKSLWAQYGVDTISARNTEKLADRIHLFENGLLGPIGRHPVLSTATAAALGWQLADKD